MAGVVLELRNLSKRITTARQEPFTIFENVSLSVREGEFVSIVGPSGCGKTTLLRVINGLLPPSSAKLSSTARNRKEPMENWSWALSFRGLPCSRGARV